MSTDHDRVPGPTDPIVSFTGRYRFLSNFYPSRICCQFHFVDHGAGEASGFTDWAATVEHAYQASKALRDADCHRVLKAATAAEARRLGRALRAVKPDWDEVRVPTMRELVRLKFENDARLAKMLLATDARELVHGNAHRDRFWGRVQVFRGTVPTTWEGENWLGRILMERRSALRVARQT